MSVQGIFSILDYGADPSGATDSTAAIQAAANAVTAGGILWIPFSGFNVSGTVNITKPMTILGSHFVNTSTGSINATGTSTLFNVTASDVTFRDLYLNRADAPSGNAIDVGQDVTSVADAAITSGQKALNSASANFTSSDVGKYVAVVGAGAAGNPLLSTIASVPNPTTAMLADAAGGTVSGAIARYGTMYRGLVVDNVEMTNHAIGLNLGSVGEYHILDSKITATTPIVINNLVSAGFGASSVAECYLFAGATGYGVIFNSGSDVRFTTTKWIGGIYCFYMNWNQFAEGNLTIDDGSLESYTTAAIFITAAASFERIAITGNSAAGPGGTFLIIDNAGGASPADVIVTDNEVRFVGFAGIGMSIGKVSQALIADNIIDFGGSGTGIALLSQSDSCTVGENYYSVATPFTNAGTNNFFDTSVGVTVANLPAGAGNGSRLFATDGVPGSIPAAGSGTGAMVVRQNGAWICLGSLENAFSVHKNGANQTGVPSSAWTQVSWSTKIYDIGSGFASNGWTPLAGKVTLSFAFYATGAIAAGNVVGAAIAKNGVVLKNGLAFSGINQCAANVSCDDVASGSDVYTAKVYIVTSSGSAIIDGNSNNSFFTGHRVSS